MYAYEKRNEPSLKGLVKTAFSFVVIAGFAMITLSTGDPLWFWPTFSERPQEIVLNCYGEELVLSPGDTQFEALTTVFNDNFSGYKNWDSLSLSEETWQAYQTDDVQLVMVLNYATPIRVHSFYKYFSGVDRLIVPLDGRHAKSNPVFGMTEDIPAAGALHIENTAPLTEFLSSEGLCQADANAN